MNEELFSYGLSNVVTSFFSGFPACVALSRSAIVDSVGAKSQVISQRFLKQKKIFNSSNIE